MLPEVNPQHCDTTACCTFLPVEPIFSLVAFGWLRFERERLENADILMMDAEEG